ncbi:MAG: hypothetical protein MUE73_09820 [Planctomycetes bacterium]|nr:hypothetical protein [Planctomycetota bacterium]
MRRTVRPRTASRSASPHFASDHGSMALVGSSRTRIGVRRAMARASASRCHSPVDSSTPPAKSFPSIVPEPRGSDPISSSAPAALAASASSPGPRAWPAAPKAMLSATDAW